MILNSLVMKRLLLLFLPALLSAQSYGPWASKNIAPSWWAVLHDAALETQIETPTQVNRIPVPVYTGVTVSFSPQGNMPWLPSNVDVDYLVICGPFGTSVAAGLIYQLANANGIMALSPASVQSLLTRRKALNPWSLLIEVGKDASIGIPVLGESKIISMTAPWIVALLSGHVLFENVQNQVESRIPDPGPTISMLLDPKSTINFSNSCSEATMGVGHRPNKKKIAGTFPLKAR